jgi:hypothetical protein
MACCGTVSVRPRDETLIRIPGTTAHLVAGYDGPVELARGDLSVVTTHDHQGRCGTVAVPTVVRVGRDLGWPLAQDEPVVKLDLLHYLFTLPDRDVAFLNYGVSFAATRSSAPSASGGGFWRSWTSRPPPLDAYWNEFAPRVEGYNGVLAKAIAAGTGQLVKDIFMCSEAYASQVLCSPSLPFVRTSLTVPCIMADVSVLLCFLHVPRGAELFRPQSADGTAGTEMRNQAQSGAKRGAVNKSLKRWESATFPACLCQTLNIS